MQFRIASRSPAATRKDGVRRDPQLLDRPDPSLRNQTKPIQRTHRGRIRHIVLRVLTGLGLLLVLLAALSALSNLLLPSRSPMLDHLSDMDKARLSEAVHLRQTVGDQVWSGWSQAGI